MSSGTLIGTGTTVFTVAAAQWGLARDVQALGRPGRRITSTTTSSDDGAVTAGDLTVDRGAAAVQREVSA